MHIGQALDLVSRYDSLRNPLASLGDYLDPELISRCLEESGTVTLRKRRLPLEMMVWCIVGMALERKEPLHQIVNRLDIMLPGNRPFVAPSAVIQARQRLGSEAVRRVFTQTAQLWHNATPHPHWCGLTLLAIDGVFWRTPDTPENDKAFRPDAWRKPGALSSGKNGLSDGADQPSADGSGLRHDEKQRK
jgi:putative transposase